MDIDYSKFDTGLARALVAWTQVGGDGEGPPAGITITLRFEGGIEVIEALGFEAHGAADGEAEGVVRFRDVAAIAASPAVLWMSAGSPRGANLDTAVGEIRARASSDTTASATGDGLWHAAADGTFTAMTDATGAGVIVAIIDTGIDYTHPMFMSQLTPTKVTRIKRIWDQGLRAAAEADCPARGLLYSPTPTPSHTYGVEFDNTEIEAALNSDTPLPTRDCKGHGTHVAGIAAGGRVFADGGNARVMGVAPEADIIVVKYLDVSHPITYFTGPAGTEVGETQRFRDAIFYCLRTARAMGKPVVINMSFGDTSAPGDGLDAESVWLDQVLDPAHVEDNTHFPSRAILVKAAGNDGDPAERLSARIVMPALAAGEELVVPLELIDTRAGTNETVRNCVRSTFKPPISVHLWYRRATPSDAVKFALRLPYQAGFSGDMPVGGHLEHGFGARLRPVRTTVLVPMAETTHRVYVTHRGDLAVTHPSGTSLRRHNVELTVYPKVVRSVVSYYAGTYELRIRAPAGTEIFLLCGLQKWGSRALRVAFGVGTTVRGPMNTQVPMHAAITVSSEYSAVDAGGQHVLTVAAYNDADGVQGNPEYQAIAAFSSRGPLRDFSDPPLGVIADKPDIAAPGVEIMSAHSRDFPRLVGPQPQHWYDGLNRFTPMGGTSMAAPMVAGVVALMLDKNPDLAVSGPGGVRNLLRAAARAGVNPSTAPAHDRAYGAGMIDALQSHVDT